jgi:hypothetical protein
MGYLSAAQCATAPEDILFKFSCSIEIVNFSSVQWVGSAADIPDLIPKYDCAAT